MISKQRFYLMWILAAILLMSFGMCDVVKAEFKEKKSMKYQTKKKDSLTFTLISFKELRANGRWCKLQYKMTNNLNVPVYKVKVIFVLHKNGSEVKFEETTIKFINANESEYVDENMFDVPLSDSYSVKWTWNE